LALSDRGRSVAAARRDDLPWGAVLVGYGTCFAHLCAGKLAVARDLARMGYRSAVGAGIPLIAGHWAALGGFVAAAQGRVAEALNSLREAVVALETGDGFGLLRCCTAGVGLATALSGNPVEARSWLARSDQLATPANRLFTPWIELWRAWVQAADGATTKAIETARHAVSVAHTAKAPTVEALALYDVVRLGGEPDVRRLGTLAESLDIPITPVLVTAATGQATSDGRRSGELLAEAAVGFESLGHHLLAMEARLGAARAYRRAGSRRNANLQAERAVALREKCPAARTPMSARDDTISVLTRREREVVLLAPDHSSKEIGERLGLSVRTVDNYLVKSYAKLQISGRADLRALLPGTGSGIL
jgi:ATP/maltotriose-dependent transcriptional regulator MalT